MLLLLPIVLYKSDVAGILLFILVSETDLFEALKNNIIKGAALDVFDDEPAKDNILFGLENIILTPHIAASTSEAQIIVAEMIANQFVDFFLKNKINNQVT